MLNPPAIQTPLNPRVFVKPPLPFPPPLMAVTTKITQLRPKSLHITTITTTATKIHSPASLHYFSSSSNSSSDPNGDPNPESNSGQSQSPSSRLSFLDSIKGSLGQPQQQTYPRSQQPPGKSFSSGPSDGNHQKSLFTEEMKKKLAGFRSRTAPPPPPAGPISFEELYERIKGEGSTAGGPIPFMGIQNSLRNMIPNTRVNRLNNVGPRPSLKFVPVQTPGSSPPGIIGSGFPSSMFEPEEMAAKDRDNESGRTDLVKAYDHAELGEKLMLLRPDKKTDKKDWFSFEELNYRLARLREVELKESESKQCSGIGLLKDSVKMIRLEKNEGNRKNMPFRLSTMGLIGITPSSDPPKEELVEKYFHPDNMSASESLKIELHKVRDEFKMSESDCGSARVQVAQLTTKIKHLSGVLHKKDKHSRKGLQAMVEKRKKLLKYMRRTDWESYCFVLTKLGLRDNPGYKH